MLRRSERISKNQPITPYTKLRNLTDKFKTNITKNGSKNSRVYILNELYKIVYNDFYEIRHDMHKTTDKKEDFFVNLIKSFEKRGKIILDELTEEENMGLKSSNKLKRNIIKTSKKIRKYLDNVNSEKKNVFVLLSSKIGVDVITNINSYL